MCYQHPFDAASQLIAVSVAALLLASCGAQDARTPPDPALVKAGAKVFGDTCNACHNLTSTGAVGPSLEGIIGREVGGDPNFDYSPGLSNDSLIWTEERVVRFLQDPLTMYPDSKMVITPLEPADARAVATFLAAQ